MQPTAPSRLVERRAGEEAKASQLARLPISRTRSCFTQRPSASPAKALHRSGPKTPLRRVRPRERVARSIAVPFFRGSRGIS